MNVVEVTLGFIALFLHLKSDPRSVVLGFGVALMTLAKTVLYLLLEYISGMENVIHNDLRTLMLLYIIPNGVWIIVPTLVVFAAGSRLTRAVGLALKTKQN
jgi:hypothetical protein